MRSAGAPPPAGAVRAEHPFERASDPAESLRELGYAFLHGVLEPEKLRSLRSSILRDLADAGWLAPGSDPELGVPGQVVHDDADLADYLPVYRTLQSKQAFHELGHDEALVAAIEEILGETAFCLPCKMARIKFPRGRSDRPPTPPHQDYGHIQCSIDTLTAWVPLAHTPAGQGRLAVAAGSHRLGLRHVPGMPFDGAAGDLEWHASDFEVGDVLVFHSLAVHAAEDNPTDRVRITVDFRYQPLSDPVSAHMLEPHYLPFQWPELDAEWSNAGLRRYWERVPLELAWYTQDPALLVERARGLRSRFVPATVVDAAP